MSDRNLDLSVILTAHSDVKMDFFGGIGLLRRRGRGKARAKQQMMVGFITFHVRRIPRPDKSTMKIPAHVTSRL